ncbi:MAG TPA: hypothetical protein VFN74_22700 [Chloroflexota bacterium]|nr:hypothetical protein [Chloroflexota bacterium]
MRWSSAASATLVPTAVLVAWFVAAAVVLLRGGTPVVEAMTQRPLFAPAS